MRASRSAGFSLIETLVALSLVVCVSAAVLPAVVLASRLQRESAIETEAASVAATCLERLKAAVAEGRAGAGGAIETPVEGWYELIDRENRPAPRADASFECRWQVSELPVPPGVRVLAVRVVALAHSVVDVAVTTAVADE